MLPLVVYFIAVPPDVWASWPPDRSLQLLGQDALGIERRIAKGVDLVRERSRYRMLCERIETLALSAMREGRAQAWTLLPNPTDDTPSAGDYLLLVESLRTAQSSPAPVQRISVGKTVHPPAVVSSQRELYSRAGRHDPALLACAHFKAAVYEEAERSGSAVVEAVLPAYVETTTKR